MHLSSEGRESPVMTPNTNCRDHIQGGFEGPEGRVPRRLRVRFVALIELDGVTSSPLD